MLVDTVGDELKIANGGKSRVIGISLKDRSAILLAGHMADAAYWFDNKSGNFVSSTYYFADLPGWVKDFNGARPADRFSGATWLNRKMPEDPKKLYTALETSPFGDELVEALAERAFETEQLGRRDAADLLAISFSSNDYVGHQTGPDSPEVHEMCLRTDRLLDKLLQAADRQAGPGNVLVVLTADHGVAPGPEVNNARRMPGGRMSAAAVRSTIQAALVKKYGEGNWIVNSSGHSMYFDLALIAQKKLDPAEVNRTAAQAALEIPHVFRVYTREQLAGGAALQDQVGQRVRNGFNVRRSPGVELLLEPYWMFDQTGATHGTAFSYDVHVPVIFMGPGIRAGRFHAPIAVNDIAPTLATILDVETPSGSAGRVLAEIIVE
jgi:hypothetical protein